MQILQLRMADSSVTSLGASDFLWNCLEETAPITEGSVTNTWCNLITMFRCYPSWCRKVVASSSLSSSSIPLCNHRDLNCHAFHWQLTFSCIAACF